MLFLRKFIFYHFAIFTLLFFVAEEIASGQNNIVFSDKLEEIFEGLEDESITDPALLDLYVELSQLPVNINSRNEQELSRLFFLSGYQVKSLLYHTQTAGDIVSVYEIASIPGFDRQIVEMMIPFVSLDSRDVATRQFLNNELITNIAVKPHSNDTTKLGSPYKVLTKYKATYGDWQGGFTIEKDAGEPFFSGKPTMPDFFSGHLSYSGKGFIKRIIVGDYSIKFGQGTNLNTQYSTSLSLSGNSIASNHDILKGNTSANENNFFRGAAVQIGDDNIVLSLMASHKKIDASLDYSPQEGDFIKTLYTAGLHDTENNMNKKDVVTETDFAINMAYNFAIGDIGANYSYNHFSLPFIVDHNDPLSVYDFNGTSNHTFSSYYSIYLNYISLWGEVSTNNFANKALVQGVMLRPTDRFSFSALYRNYNANYTSFSGSGPGGKVSNKKGLYFNAYIEIARSLFVTAGYEAVRFPWIKYRVSFPSKKQRGEIKINYEPSSKALFSLAYKYRYAESNEKSSIGMPKVGYLQTHSVKFSGKITPYEQFVLTTRGEYKKVEQSNYRGFAIAQDMSYSFLRVPFSIWFRTSYFDINNWESRIYIYENDLLYNFSIPALYGKGTHHYLMVKWDIGKWCDLRIKYGITVKKENVGNHTITDEIKLQIKLNL